MRTSTSACARGRRVDTVYCPAAELYHLESVTRGTEVRRARAGLAAAFWERWGDFFDARDVRNAAGALRMIYVTQDSGVGGGHRVVFEHLNRLLDRGHEVELWTLGSPPDWFDVRVPVRNFEKYTELTRGADADRRAKGRDVVGHGRRQCGRGAWSTASRSISCRTSRRATTPCTRLAHDRCWPVTVRVPLY